ncbi:MAG: hypothetical protein KatS3mg043_0919 [Rhodothermaceae bacterium]|nr:MAG: hypothetical protein KatS3mg043_0919 [Rhodothermaceae bacterium]
MTFRTKLFGLAGLMLTLFAGAGLFAWRANEALRQENEARSLLADWQRTYAEALRFITAGDSASIRAARGRVTRPERFETRGSRPDREAAASLAGLGKKYREALHGLEEQAVAAGKLDARLREHIRIVEAAIGETPLRHLEFLLLQLRRAEQAYLLRGEEQYVGEVRQVAAALAEATREAWLRRRIKESILGGLEAYLADFEQLVAAKETLRAQVQALGALRDEAGARLGALVEARREDARRARRLMLGMLGLALVLGGGAMVSLSGTLLKSLRRLEGLVSRLAGGHLDAPVEPRRRDEVGRIGTALGVLAARLQRRFEHTPRLVEGLTALGDAADRDAALRALLDELRAMTGARGAALVLYDRNGHVEARHVVNLDEQDLDTAEAGDEGETGCGQDAFRIRLTCGDHRLGWLYLAGCREEEAFREKDGTLLAAVARLAARLLHGRAAQEALQRTYEHLCREVDRIAVTVEHLAEGDLRVEVEAKEEGGVPARLQRAVAGMVTGFRQRFLRIHAAAGTTAAAAMQIREATGRLAGGVREASAQTGAVAAAFEEMARTIAENARQAAHTAEVATQSGAVAREGGAIVAQTVEKIRQIAGVVGRSAEKIEHLGASSGEIGKIVSGHRGDRRSDEPARPQRGHRGSPGGRAGPRLRRGGRRGAQAGRAHHPGDPADRRDDPLDPEGDGRRRRGDAGRTAGGGGRPAPRRPGGGGADPCRRGNPGGRAADRADGRRRRATVGYERAGGAGHPAHRGGDGGGRPRNRRDGPGGGAVVPAGGNPGYAAGAPAAGRCLTEGAGRGRRRQGGPPGGHGKPEEHARNPGVAGKARRRPCRVCA